MAGIAADPAVAGESVDAKAGYRPHLDGLRAVAVYLVLLFHAGLGGFSGGYIGVDVFFVLSGFLVTRLLLRDIERNGSIRLSRFYSRRFRRLLPAAFVALIVTGAVYTAIASPLEVADVVGSFKAAFLYSANWYFIHQSSGYFAADVSMNPVLPFWSLAVEEQFYLVWPLLLGGAFILTRRLDPRRQTRAIVIGVSVAMLASVIWALSLKATNLNRAYYGTDARAYELFAGALIALVPALATWAARRPRSMRLATVASMGALLIISTSWVHLEAIERGIAATIAAFVLIVAIEASDGVVKRVLSSRQAVYLGRISYGTYLWHWLVILVVLRAFDPSPIATFAIAGLVATALALLSFEALERPVRTWAVLDRHRRAVIALGLAISVVSALVLIPRVVDPAKASTASPRRDEPTLLTPIPKGLDLLHARRLVGYRNCVRRPVSRCVLIKGTGRRVLLMGDSHAWAISPTFIAIVQRGNLELSVSLDPDCPWQRDLYTPFRFASCRKWQDDMYERVIPKLKPDVVVVMNLAFGAPGFPVYIGPDQKKVDDAAIAAATEASASALQADGRDLLIMEPIPVPASPSTHFNPLACLAKATALEQCRYKTEMFPSPLEVLYRRISMSDPRVRTLDLDRSVCPLRPVCDPVVDGRLVKWDRSHLTVGFARSLAPEVDTYLKSVGFLPR